MVTVLDPGGTPIPVYSPDGVTLSAINANGTTQGSATQVVRYTSTTVVVVTISSGNDAVELPSSAAIGDLVEVYLDDPGGIGIRLFTPGSETFVFGGNVANTVTKNLYCRKFSSSVWGIIS